MGNTKYKVIIGFLVVLLAAALCAICFLLGRDTKKEETRKEPETKEIEKKEDSEEKEKDEKKEEEPTKETTKKEEKQDYKIKEVLFDTTSYGNDDVEKVELTSDGVVLVTMTGTENDVNKKEIAKDVVKTFMVQVGQNDICEGGKRLMFVHKDGTASYLSVDDLTCGQNIVVDKLNGVKNIEKFEVKTIKHDGEPDEHITYVITKDGKKTDITAKIA